MKFLTKKYTVLGVSLLLSLLGGFLYLGQKSFHLDEVASIAIVRDGSLLAVKLWHYEGNMWLYYILLHFWLKLGLGVATVRSFSLLWGVLTIIPFYLLTEKLFSKRTANLAVLLLPLQVLFIKNMQFVRGYSLEMFLVVLSSYLLVLMLEKRSSKTLLLYSLISILAIYTHLYSGLVVAAQLGYVFLFGDRDQKAWIIAADFVIFAGILPLLLSPAIKSGQINWIAPPDSISLAATFVMLTGDLIPLSAVVLLLIAGYLWQARAGLLKHKQQLLVLCWIIFPIAMAFIFSLTVKPIYNLQYFTIVLPPFVMLMAEALLAIKKTWLYRLALTIVVLLSLVRLGLWYTESTQRYMAIPNVNEPWSQVADYIQDRDRQDDAIIVFPTYTYIIYDYYATNPALPLEPLRLVTGKPAPFNEAILHAVPNGYKRVWYVYNERAGSATDPRKKEIEGMLKSHYKIKDTHDWYQLHLTLYEK